MENAKRNPARKPSAVPSVVSLEAGKLPPQAVEFEQAVLGAMMIDHRAVDRVVNIFQDNDEVFYRPEHRHIYGAIVRLYNDTKPIDLLTVGNELRSAGLLDAVGGDFYLVQLTQKVSSAANIEFHARVVQQKYFQRELILLSTDIINKSYDDSTDVFDLLDDAESAIFNITNTNIKKSYEKADDLVHQAIKRIEELSKQEGGISGLPSGFREIDKCTAGWQGSDLVVIAARPGMGKTAFVLNVAENVAIKQGITTAIFSLEMSNVQLVNRMLSLESTVDADKLRKGRLDSSDWGKLIEGADSIAKSHLIIDDTPGISISELRSKCRKYKMENDLGLVIIDYLQLMSGSGRRSDNRQQEISDISRALKALARELNVPVVTLSQLSRAVEQRPDHRPMLSDLRESGAIEQDADVVMFLYRDDYYNKDTDIKGIAEIIIAKQRNGPIGTVKMAWIPEQTRFADLLDRGQRV